MLALLSDITTDAISKGVPIGGGLIVLTMLKMLWDDRTRGAKIEAGLRSQFAAERTARELEFTAEKATAKADYSDSLIRHQEIHKREIAAFQDRITRYIEELGTTKDRVTVLEAEVKDLRAR